MIICLMEEYGELKNTSCSRQTIKHDGKLNPPMLFDTSGSPVIYKECGKYVLHGLHGNGMDYKGYVRISSIASNTKRMDTI